MASPEQWRWADDHGVQRLLGADELRAALELGHLRPQTLVWRRGMAEWVRAESLPELASMRGAAGTVALPADLGAKAPHSPSIPEPVGTDDSTSRHAKRTGLLDGGAHARRQKSTLMGVGDGVSEVPSRRTDLLAVPLAPRLLTLADVPVDEENTHVAVRPSSSRPQPTEPAKPSGNRGSGEAPPLKSRRPVKRASGDTTLSAIGDAAPSAQAQRERPVTQAFPSFSTPGEGGVSDRAIQSFVAGSSFVGGSTGEGLFSMPPVVGVDDSESMSPSPPRSRRFSVTDRALPSDRQPRRVSAKMLGIGAVAALLLVAGSFAVGRFSGSSKSVPAVTPAQVGWVTVPLYSRARSAGAMPRPCLMQAAPARWAAKAERAIPIELVPSTASALAVGYGRTASEPRGLVYDMDTGQITSTHEPDSKVDGLVRVAPLESNARITFAAVAAEQDGITHAIYLRAEKPMLVGVVGDDLAVLAEAGATPRPLWKVPGPITRLQVAPFGVNAVGGFGVVYIASDRVWYGAAKTDGTILHEPAALESAGKVGKPMLASNGRDVSVVYAEGVPGDVPVRVRWAHGPISEPLTTAPFVELPAGGPGGDAIAPDIAALPENRWILVWTEGREGDRALRAQTFDSRRVRVGSALRVSPETGNFGQGTLAVVGDRAAVAFLLKTDSYQLWGTVLQCR